MTGFAWPLMFLLLPLPLLIRSFFSSNRANTDEALRVPFYKDIANLKSSRFSSVTTTQAGKLRFLWLIWILLLLAAARPQWVGDPLAASEKVRNMITVLDISGSMGEKDFVIDGNASDRLSVVKKVMDEFVAKREGDRVGVVAFGTRSYLYVPLTGDIKTAREMIAELELGFAGPQTAMGDGMGLAFKSMDEVPAESKVVILLSDGAINAGALNVPQAIRLAEQMKVKVYTIGIGAYEKQVRGMFGVQTIDPSADLDEATLREIAEKTGGKYFRAYDTNEFRKIYDEINSLEPVKTKGFLVKPVKELFYIPLALAVLSVAIMFASVVLGVRKL